MTTPSSSFMDIRFSHQEKYPFHPQIIIINAPSLDWSSTCQYEQNPTSLSFYQFSQNTFKIRIWSMSSRWFDMFSDTGLSLFFSLNDPAQRQRHSSNMIGYSVTSRSHQQLASMLLTMALPYFGTQKRNLWWPYVWLNVHKSWNFYVENMFCS